MKQKTLLGTEICRILGADLPEKFFHFVGEVSLISATVMAVHIDCRANTDIMYWCLQVVHIFSHIHQTYIVYSVRLKDQGPPGQQSEDAQWLTRSVLLEAAVSTGVKKV